ncbi:MAG: UvrD-helicase domain-containing protein [Acidobacteria bacterium]|nr:UvrD-helicase domain-containing protein [Acidobacteriota bacterium]
MTDLIDASARAMICHDGLDRTLFVEAGAGTGKTTQLVERVVNLVCNRGVAIGEIAAITFTEAAAAELRMRLRDAFEQRRRDAASAEHVAVVDAALDDLDVAAISTLHAFAQRVVVAHGTAIGIPPGIEVLDEVESLLGFQARWSEFLDELYERRDAEELIIAALMLDISIDNPHRNGLRQVALAMNDNWDRLEHFRSVDQSSLQVDWAPAFEGCKTLKGLVEQCNVDDDPLVLRVLEEFIPFVLSINDADSTIERLRLLASHKGWKPGRLGRKENWDDVAEVRSQVVEVSDTLSNLRATVVDAVLLALAAAVATFTERAADARARSGQLEFHDLLVQARRLVCSNSAARLALHERYRYLLLDEFQDSDPIQVEIAVAIAANSSLEDGWEAAQPPEGSLFFVGDPKQSIYRFRRADIALFLAAREAFGGSDVVRLSQNFRTVEPVVEFVNAVFGDLMAKGVPGRQPAYEPLRSGRPSSIDADHRPTVFGHAHEEANAGELRTFEAGDVAAHVSAMLIAPEHWPVFDRPSKQWRPMRPEDVAVLVPTRTSLTFLQDAFGNAGVDYRLETGTLLYDTDEVREVLLTLAAVDDPGDEIAIVGALRSSLLGVTDVELAQWRTQGLPLDYRLLPVDGPVGAALGFLAELHDRRWSLSLSALIEQIYVRRHVAALAYGTSRPEDRMRSLRFLLDQARLFADSNGGDLRRFLAWAKLQAADGARVHEPVADDGSAAVRILTMHGSKGLEYPIVFLSGLTTQIQKGSRGPQIYYGNDSAAPEVSLTKNLETTNFDRIRDLEAEMDGYEACRLLYVAATRARDHLFVSGHHRSKTSSHGATMFEAARCHSGLVRSPGRPVPARVDQAAVRGVETNEVESHTSGDRSHRKTESTRSSRHQWQQARATALDAAARQTVVAASSLNDSHRPSGRGERGTAIGLALHAVMEQVDLVDPVGIEALATHCAAAEGITEQAPTIAAMAIGALGCDVMMLARDLPHHREVFVAAPFEDRVIEGYIDLLIEGPDGLIVVDYKTDVADPAELETAYGIQLASYAYCLEHSTGRNVTSAVLLCCSVSSTAARSIDLTAASRELRERLAPVGPLP